MKLEITPKSRNTGNAHTLVEQDLATTRARLTKDGKLVLDVQVGPMETSGNSDGTLTLTIAEIYGLLGILEERKLAAIRSTSKA
jgi:hypothetical protein